MKQAKSIIKKIGASKVLIFVLLIVLQIGLYYSLYNLLENYIGFIFGGYTILTFFVIIAILNNNSNPMYKIAWIMPVLLLPGVGTLLYIYVHLDSLYKSIKTIFKRSKQKTVKYLEQNDIDIDKPGLKGISNYCFNTCNYPTYQNTETKYLKCGEDYFEEVLKELKKAEKFILLEYFIINNDYMWQTILNILIQKVKEGVEVKVMYDGFGSLLTLPSKYNAYLKRYGIEVGIFSKVSPFLAIHQNNRDHRKILVIDGKVGFTGGINLADEYINKKIRFGHWKDTGIMLKGEAVKSLTMMFFELWSTCTYEKVKYENYISDEKCVSDGYVIPYSDSPYDNINIGEDVYLNIINSANEYLYITTPYLILDDILIRALANASKRGVKVTLVLPHIPDKQYAYSLAVSHYKTLLDYGIEIYEYTPGFIHAKMFLADDIMGVVGTINLDYRSLYLHFECATFLYGTSSLKDIKKDIEETIEKSQSVTKKYIKTIPFTKKIAGKLLKLVAPLM